MATLASLTVNLLARTNRFTQPVQAAARTVQRFDRQADRMQQTLRRVEGATMAARRGLLAGAAALGIATKQGTEYADAILAVHKQTGLAVESTQALRYAAQQSHTDIATLEKGLRSFVRRAAEAAEGNASMARGFDRLGVDVLDTDGRLKDTETLLMEVADGAARAGSEAEASGALMLVMGDAGRRLVPFMQQGASGIRGLMDEAERMGLVMERNAILTLDRLGDEATTTSNRLGAMSRDLAYRFSPAVQVALGWANRLIDSFFDLSAEQRQNIVRWTAYIGMVLGAVAAIGVLARVLVAGIGVLRAFATAMSLLFSPLVLYIALAGMAIAAFKVAWENDWLGIRTAATDAWENYIKPVWSTLSDGVDAAWKWAVDTAGSAWEYLTTTTWTEKVEDARALIEAGWSWAISTAKDGWKWITDTTWSEKIEDIESLIVGGWQWAIDRGGKAWAWMDEHMPATTNAIRTMRNLVVGGWNWTITQGGKVWAWLDEHAPAVTDTIRTMRDIITGKWEWEIDKEGTAWGFIDSLVPGEVRDWAGARIAITFETFGALYDKIKDGIETGDWSGVWGVTADAWREGVKIAVTLGLAANTITHVMNAIRLGFGLTGMAATGIRALGVPGAIGAISLAVALMEAKETGDFKAFGATLVAALAAGIGAGVILGPHAGGLAFTIFLNFEVGKWIFDSWKEGREISDRVRNDVEELTALGEQYAESIRTKPYDIQPSIDALEIVNRRLKELGADPIDPWADEVSAPDIIDLIRGMSDEYDELGRLIPDMELAEFMLVLASTESSLENVANKVSTARGEFQLLAGTRGKLEELMDGVDWDDPTERTKAAFEWLRQGLVNEFGTISDAAERLGIDIAEALHLWWVMGGPDLGKLTSLDEVVTMDASAADILGRRQQYIGSFARGGYTGNAPVDQVVGVVHGQELVIPAPAVRRGLDGILQWLGVPGYQDGKGEGYLRGALESARPTLESLSPGLADTLIKVLGMLEQGVGWVQEHYDELMKAIKDGPEAIDDAIKSARELAEEQEIAAKQQAALNGLTAQLIGRMPILDQVLDGIEAGAAYGPVGSIIGALAALAMQSETMATAFGIINDLLQVAADAVGMLLEPLLPLIHVLQSVLVPVFNVLGTVLEAVLLPIMPFLFEALKWLGVVVLFVGEVFQRVRSMVLDAIGGLVVGIAEFINSIPFLSANTMLQAGKNMQRSAQDARDSADEMARARDELIGLTYDEAMARAKNTEELERATAAMINIPQGFRYALARAEAATPRAAPASVSPSPSATVHPRATPGIDGGAGLSGRGDVHKYYFENVYGWDDFKRKVQQAQAEGKRNQDLSSYGFGGAT